MKQFEVAHIFVECIARETVRWYKDSYEDCRNGTRHSVPHLEIVSHLHVVREAVEASDIVNEDRAYKDRRCYYVWFPGDAAYSAQYMKAIVKRTFYGKLKVITAYFTKAINAAEVKIWPTT